MRLRGNVVVIGVGDVGGGSGACVEVAGDGCLRTASGADADGDDKDGYVYDARRMVEMLAMLTAPAKG